MKVVVIVLVLVLTYLFYPFYDLYAKDDPFAEQFSLVHKGYWSKGGCAEAASAEAAEVYFCRKQTLWGKMFNTYTQYDPSIREIRKDQGQFDQ